MKTKLSAFALLILSNTVFAQQLHVWYEQQVEAPYLAYVYSCDPMKWFSLPNNKIGFKLVVDKPPLKTLILSRSQYDLLRQQGKNDSWKFINANKEVTRGYEKIKQFEDAGNIEAMRHWQNKTMELVTSIQLDYINNRVREAGERIIKEQGLQPYYSPYSSSPQKYTTFAEMVEIHDKNCMLK